MNWKCVPLSVLPLLHAAGINTECSLYTASKKQSSSAAWSFLLAFKMEMGDICTIVSGSDKAV